MSLDSRLVRWIGWTLSILVVAFMIFDGGISILALDFVIKGMTEFGFPPSYARPLGAMMLFCTALYAVPHTAVLGAILLTGFLGGTIATHLPRPDPLLPHILVALVMGAVVWGGLWLREPRLRALIPLRWS